MAELFAVEAEAVAVDTGHDVSLISTHHLESVDRDSQDPSAVYVEPDESAWWTPDGIGRYYYDDLESALEDRLDEVDYIAYLELPTED